MVRWVYQEPYSIRREKCAVFKDNAENSPSSCMTAEPGQGHCVGSGLRIKKRWIWGALG